MTFQLPSFARAAALAVPVVGLLLGPLQASASPETLRRGMQNVVNGPLDVILGPVAGGLTLIQNMREVDDPLLVRVVVGPPGFIWLSGLNMGAGGIRMIVGVFEMIPGVFLFPFATDLDPMMPPTERAPAIIDVENPLAWNESPWIRYNPIMTPLSIHLRFGLNYTTSN